MGFRLTIEADYRSEVLQNIHPEGKDSGGKAVLSFIVGLSNYLALERDDNLDDINQWYKKSEQITGYDYAPLYQSLVDCMWGDGGDSTEYQEEDYEFYLHRTNQKRGDFTQAQFRQFLTQYYERWQPIDKVIAGVDHLLQILVYPELEKLEGFYEPDATFSDFEALQHNLKLLKSRGNTTIRLNFR